MTERLYSHVLVPTDFGPDSRAAYRVAIAAALGSGAMVSLIHVLPVEEENKYTGLDAIGLLHRAAEHIGNGKAMFSGDSAAVREHYLNRLRSEVHPEWFGAVDFRVEVRRGDLVDEIAGYARETAVDLIVAASPRPRFLTGFGRNLPERLARATSLKVVQVTAPAAT